MRIDYHVHTPYCGHAEGALVNYVERAIEEGIQEIGFADHLGRYYLGTPQKRRYWDWGMDERFVARYITEVNQLQEVYRDRITVRVGLEVDYIEGAEELLGRITSRYPLDFIVGSIHCLPPFGWHHLSEICYKESDRIYSAYFDAAEAGIKSGQFQIMGHLDFVWRYIRWPFKGSIDVLQRINEAIRLAAHHHIAVEINVNSLLWSQHYRVEEWDPFEAVLEAVKNSGAVVTVGSDAHTPSSVGKEFSPLYEFLDKKGIDVLATFEKKRLIVMKTKGSTLH